MSGVTLAGTTHDGFANGVTLIGFNATGTFETTTGRGFKRETANGFTFITASGASSRASRRCTDTGFGSSLGNGFGMVASNAAIDFGYGRSVAAGLLPLLCCLSERFGIVDTFVAFVRWNRALSCS